MAMLQNTTPSWHEKLTRSLSEDPKKTGFLGVLVAVLLVVGGRMLIGGGHPSLAAGSVPQAFAGLAQPFVPSPVLKPGGAGASLREWLSTPIPPIGRNDFLVKSDNFPGGSTKKNSPPSDSPFWVALAKSFSVQADQKEKREAVIASLKEQAAALRPTGIVMGPSPRAMVGGTLVREGDMVGSFRVVRIEERGIVVENDGVRLAVPME